MRECEDHDRSCLAAVMRALATSLRVLFRCRFAVGHCVRCIPSNLGSISVIVTVANVPRPQRKHSSLIMTPIFAC